MIYLSLEFEPYNWVKDEKATSWSALFLQTLRTLQDIEKLYLLSCHPMNERIQQLQFDILGEHRTPTPNQTVLHIVGYYVLQTQPAISVILTDHQFCTLYILLALFFFSLYFFSLFFYLFDYLFIYLFIYLFFFGGGKCKASPYTLFWCFFMSGQYTKKHSRS